MSSRAFVSGLGAAAAMMALAAAGGDALQPLPNPGPPTGLDNRPRYPTAKPAFKGKKGKHGGRKRAAGSYKGSKAAKKASRKKKGKRS